MSQKEFSYYTFHVHPRLQSPSIFHLMCSVSTQPAVTQSDLCCHIHRPAQVKSLVSHISSSSQSWRYGRGKQSGGKRADGIRFLVLIGDIHYHAETGFILQIYLANKFVRVCSFIVCTSIWLSRNYTELKQKEKTHHN